MFSPNQRVKHVQSELFGVVIAQRINMGTGKEELRVLFDDQDRVTAWTLADQYEGA